MCALPLPTAGAAAVAASIPDKPLGSKYRHQWFQSPERVEVGGGGGSAGLGAAGCWLGWQLRALMPPGSFQAPQLALAFGGRP